MALSIVVSNKRLRSSVTLSYVGLEKYLKSTTWKQKPHIFISYFEKGGIKGFKNVKGGMHRKKLGTTALMRIRKKSCKSFGAEFSIVRLEKVSFCSKTKLTKFFPCFKYKFSNLL